MLHIAAFVTAPLGDHSPSRADGSDVGGGRVFWALNDR